MYETRIDHHCDRELQRNLISLKWPPARLSAPDVQILCPYNAAIILPHCIGQHIEEHSIILISLSHMITISKYVNYRAYWCLQ